jgi:hypothetical protein
VEVETKWTKYKGWNESVTLRVINYEWMYIIFCTNLLFRQKRATEIRRGEKHNWRRKEEDGRGTRIENQIGGRKKENGRGRASSTT